MYLCPPTFKKVPPPLLVSTVTASFDAIMGQMTEMSQRKKRSM